jgi:hypothetical protein
MKRSLSAWVTLGCLALGCGADDGSAGDGDLDADAEAGPLPLPDEYSGAATIEVLRGPYLQNVMDDSITVMWEAVVPCRGVVEYRSGALYGFTEPDVGAARHEIVLTELPEHAALISYRIRCLSEEAVDPRATPAAAVVGAWNDFRLAAAPDEPYRFVVYADSQEFYETHARIVERMVAVAPDLAFSAGDRLTDGTRYELWDQQIFEPGAPLLATTPLFGALGNHEQDSPIFYELFSQPPPENYFAIGYGNSCHIVIDSNYPYLFPGTEEVVWLETVLTTEPCASATWRFAYFHHPPYCEGWEGYDGEGAVRTMIVPWAEAGGVDVIFNGHTHDYERGESNGVTWIITGGGGGALDPWARDIPYITQYVAAYHFVQVDVDGLTATVQAIDIDGNVIDLFSLTR